MAKKASDTGADAKASDPVTNEPVKENAPAEPQTAEKPKKAERKYRGRKCEVVKTTQNTTTGAIYDLILYPRRVLNRLDKTSSTEFLGIKLRRPGTGKRAVKEIEIETVIDDDDEV